MKKKVKKYVKEISSAIDGNASFRGGPFGFGGKAQLAAPLNPATQAMSDQEQDELDQNIDSEEHILGKHKSPSQKFILLKDLEKNSTISAPRGREPSDAQATMGAGSGGRASSRENKIEEPKTFVPFEDPRNTGDYLIDDMADEMADDIVMNLLGKRRNRKELNEMTSPAPSNASVALPPGVNIDPDDSEEEAGHTTEPTAVDVTSVGMSSVLAPKSFVPVDHEIADNPPETMGQVLKDQENASRDEKLRGFIRKMIEQEMNGTKNVR